MGISVEAYRAKIGCFVQPQCSRSTSLSNTGVADCNGNGIFAFRLLVLSLLLYAGDVESNPVPPKGKTKSVKQSKLTDEFIPRMSTRKERPPPVNTSSSTEELTDDDDSDEGNKITMNDLMRELKKTKTGLSKQIDKLSVDLNEKVTNLTDDVSQLRRELQTANETIAAMSEENKVLTGKISDMEKIVDKQEGQMKRDNLIFRGIEEADIESWDDTEVKLKEFITTNLEIDGEQIEFERAHRLVNSKLRPRPIIAKFSKYKQRDQVLGSGYKLKDTDFKITEDFSTKVREKRWKLGKFLMKARSEGKIAHLKYDKLKIDGELYVYDDYNDDIKPLHTRRT